MGILKVWFGWALWLLLIGLTLMLLVAVFDLFGNEWIDSGIVFFIELSKFVAFADSWLSEAANTLWRAAGAACCLAPIILVILLLMQAIRPRFWLKCPNCNARGWVINQEEYGERYRRGGYWLGQRYRDRKRWNRCVRCNHEYGHQETPVGDNLV
jgi:hypothetical protein